MTTGHRVAMLGTGLIGDFYTMTLHGGRSRDRVEVVYSRTAERGQAFCERWGLPHATTSIEEAVSHPDVDTVVVGVPNHLHEEAIAAAVAAGKPVLCTKPLARTAEEAKRILDLVESAGIFAGYLEDLAETLKALAAVRDEIGELGDFEMFTDMFDAIDEGRPPVETFYDGYVINAVMNACYRSTRSRSWEPVELGWRGGTMPRIAKATRREDGFTVIKEEHSPTGAAS